MKIGPWLALLGVVTAAACSSTPDRQWMKTDPYTLEEFQRDTAACTRNGDLDADCLQAKGWISVQPEQRTQAPQKAGGPSYRTPGVR